MPRQATRLPNGTQQELLRPSSESDRILLALGTMATRLGKPLNEERINQWLADTNNYPVDAVEWAVDSWSRNAKVLPTLADLLQLIRTWYKETEFDPTQNFGNIGQGYGWSDVKWLWKHRCISKQPWDDGMWEQAMEVLDREREGGAPAWRRQ